jgi:cytosolic carboxypeptidase protein 6
VSGWCLRWASAFGLALILMASPAMADRRPLCAGFGIEVRADFERARATRCQIDAAGRISVDIEPETTPINVSPWYAFSIETDAAVALQVRLNYPGFRHRYVPHVSQDRINWQRLNPASVAAEGETADFALELPAGKSWVAAQPFHTTASALAPWQARMAHGQMRRRQIGLSVGWRPILSYHASPDEPEATLLILGRVHPPEETGAWALDGFSDRLFETDELATSFRSRFAIVAVPLVNPDGFVAGHWRTNRRGIDLNRDFGRFDQPETRAVRNLVRRISRRAPVTALFDFHGTRRDLIFAQPSDAPVSQQALMEAWLSRWTAALAADGYVGDYEIERTHIADEGSSKSWAREALSLSAITYEVGDNTTLEDSTRRGRLAAEALMQVMLGR